MTTLVVEELLTNLSQTFTMKRKSVVYSIRIWIYKHLSPSGTLNLVVKQGGQTLATSEDVTSASIELNTDATSINYFHGYYRFDFSSPFPINRGDFILELQSSSYTFSESAYFGWVKPHENKIGDEDYSIASPNQNPFGVQIWQYKDRL